VSEVMMTSSDGTAGSVLEGVDLDTWGHVTQIESQLDTGSLPVNADDIVLGKALAKTLNVKVGDQIQLVAPFSGDGGGIGNPLQATFTVSGILHFGMNVSLKTLQDFLVQPDQATTLRIKLKDQSKAADIAAQLGEQFGFPYRAKDWLQLNRNLLYAISLEKTVITILMLAILLVAAFNVVSALLMMVNEKEAEISILRVLGMSRMDHFFLFTAIGSFVGLTGITLGLVGAWVLSLLLKWSKIIQLPAEVYRIEYLPVVIRASEWGLIAIAAFLICFLATVGPAMRVARKIPVEGLKWST
jgi:lipoprotein-releasing system permease protein